MKILVVDDSQFARGVIGKILSEGIENSEISYASTGEEAYKQYTLINPDCIITDLLMPGVDGKMLIKLIRHSDTNIKIIVISADVQKSVKQEVEEYGITLFINKPLDQEKQSLLINAIKEV
ncbi:MAG: response regulator [Bacillota bacterium]|nr:response regulator [Bacillota bacterium]